MTTMDPAWLVCGVAWPTVANNYLERGAATTAEYRRLPRKIARSSLVKGPNRTASAPQVARAVDKIDCWRLIVSGRQLEETLGAVVAFGRRGLLAPSHHRRETFRSVNINEHFLIL